MSQITVTVSDEGVRETVAGRSAFFAASDLTRHLQSLCEQLRPETQVELVAATGETLSLTLQIAPGDTLTLPASALLAVVDRCAPTALEPAGVGAE